MAKRPNFARAALAIVAAPDPATRAATQDEADIAARLVEARDCARQWQELADMYTDALVRLAGGARELHLPNRGKVSVISSEGRRTLDEAALIADYPELARTIESYKRV